MKKRTLAVIGECMVELSGAPFSSLDQTFGGDVLNTAVYLARCAGEAIDIRFVTAIGNDMLSLGMQHLWQKEGINTHWVMHDPARLPGLYFIQLTDSGERSFLYWRDQAAAKYLLQHEDYPELKRRLAETEMIYLSGISLAILNQEDRQALIDDLHYWKLEGVQIIFDSNYRPALWRDEAEATSAYQQLYALSDLLLVTDTDEANLWRDKNVEETRQRLMKLNHGEIVIKMGALGCQYQARDRSISPCTIPASKVEHVVDTTSAGDAFNAGLLCGLIRQQSLPDAAKFAHQLAGRVIQHQGAIIPLSTMQDLLPTPSVSSYQRGSV